MGKLINRKQYNINIPKIIHKIWFTKEPEKDLPYVVSLGNESVKKYCKDYQVITWNENNFDINISKFTRETYDTCLYGVMSDYVRLWALYNWGGIYLDSDVEILKPIDDLLNNDVFFGFEHENNTPKFVGTAIIGAKPKHPIIKTLLDYYENVNFITKNESLKIEQSNYKWPEILKKVLGEDFEELSSNGKITMYSQEELYPINREAITKNSYCIHHTMSSWCKFFGLIIPIDENVTVEELESCVETIDRLLNKSYQVIVIVGNCTEDVKSYINGNIVKKERFQVLFKPNSSIIEMVQIGIQRSHAYNKLIMPPTHVIKDTALNTYYNYACDNSKRHFLPNIYDFNGKYENEYYIDEERIIWKQNNIFLKL